MRCLIVTKPTNLEQHGDVVKAQIERGQLPKSGLEELEEAHNEHYYSLQTVRTCLAAQGIDFTEISRGDRWPSMEGINFVMSVGGDGTLLSAGHHINDDTQVIGIRSSNSSVGYLCAGGSDDIDEIIANFNQNALRTITCARLMASIYYAEEDQERYTVPVLNDFLFANHNPSATTRYIIHWGNMSEVHKSSGVWVSTATGSTAGIRAAGGIVMDREDMQFQYRVRELYQGQENSAKLTSGFFDPDRYQFNLENRNEAAVLALDGQRGVIPLRFGDRIRFERAPSLRIAAPI